MKWVGLFYAVCWKKGIFLPASGVHANFILTQAFDVKGVAMHTVVKATNPRI